MLRRGGSENTDAFCDAAVAQRDKCQNRDQDDRADDKDDAVQRVRYGYGLQAAEDCIDTADYAECDDITVVAMKRLPPISAVIPKIRSIATEPAYSTSGSMVTI